MAKGRGAMKIFSILLSFSSLLYYKVLGMSCGIDKSPESEVYEGSARIETYPWLGILYYPYNRKRFTTAVVLVTRQIVLASAAEIDKLPKVDFRARARVVIGHNCSGPDIGIRDYTYHPDFNRDTFSALAMVQLETDHVRMELRPICPPPSHFEDQYFYAMVLSENCKRSKVRIHKMNYVSPEECKNYYRRTGLDVDTLWPSHTACARSTVGGRCVWRSGAILVVKSNNRWRLLGFGVYGPGCEAPARFLDYGMYHPWVRRSIERIGRPATTTLAPNHIVLRRTASGLQRFGPCDLDESRYELYRDNTRTVFAEKVGSLRLNITLFANVEYRCIIMKAFYRRIFRNPITPRITLRRWCGGGGDNIPLCYGFGFLEVEFSIDIEFEMPVNFDIYAYGRPARVINPAIFKQINMWHEPPKLESYEETKLKFDSTRVYNDPSSFPYYVKNS